MEVMTDNVNSAEELAQDWEEIEFLVDSGASATVIGEDMDVPRLLKLKAFSQWRRHRD